MEHVERTLLAPRVPLVREVVGWLCGNERFAGRVRLVDGARSLGHVTVVVPTAQSGRSLRLALAKEAARLGWGGLLPPRVVLPMQLIVPADQTLRTASAEQLRAAFLKFVASRPRRTVAEDRVRVDEWTHLFQAEFLADSRTHLAFLDQLNDIWRILAGGGLLMRDVPAHPKAAEVLAAAFGDEFERWRELADFETAFFDFLHAHGLRHEAEGIALAKTAAKALPTETDEVVLPALADPVSVLYEVLKQQRADLKVTVLVHADASDDGKFDVWGRPVVSAWTGAHRPVLTALRDEDVVLAATDIGLAESVTADFPPAEAAKARPSLGLCDAELYPELAASFLNAGYELHNPERHRLADSSLGRMLVSLTELYAARKDDLPWTPFVALLREDDVLRVVTGGKQKPSRRNVLEGIDICRNANLPTVVPKDLAFDASRVKRWETTAFAEFLQAARTVRDLLEQAWSGEASVSVFLRRMVESVFATRRLTGAEGEKEFKAAAAVVREVLDAFDDPTVAGLGLSASATLGLVRKALAEASFSLEPDSRTAVKTEGWLELAWSAADKVALVGLHEGAVPDSVVGHPFVPDALRQALDLTTNERRLARDTMLLADLLAARADRPGSVRAYVSRTNEAGDIRRPSRLLFLVEPSRLAERVRALFGDLPGGEPKPPRILADAWRPRLPLDDVPLPGISERNPEGRLSASAIDEWLKCPFTYLLKYGLGMQRLQLKDELGADDFGTLIHRALELYALEQLDRTEKGLAQLHEEADIADALRRIVADLRASYGAHPTTRLRLQFDAAEGRLLCFARLQAHWAQDGWRVAARPEYTFETRPFAGEDGCDLPFKGSVDRIDYKDGVGYRLIDYKTWDVRDNAAGRILKGGEEERAHAARLGLPQLAPTTPKGTPQRFKSVQLLLYARCLAVAAPETFAGKIADCCYALLGKNAENTVVLGSAFDQGEFKAQKGGAKLVLIDHLNLALDTARTAIRRIRGNFFWPSGPGKSWKYDVKDVLLVSPERDFPRGTPWRDAQEAKLDGLEETK